MYKRFFDIFDLDGSGPLSFSEFVLSVWNFLTYDEKSIGHLIFLLCPRFLQLNSESQKMSESCKVCDLKMVIKALHGKLTAENSAAIDIELTRADDRWPDGTCFPDQVSLFAYENQTMFKPFMSLRDKIRRGLIGISFWSDL